MDDTPDTLAISEVDREQKEQTSGAYAATADKALPAGKGPATSGDDRNVPSQPGVASSSHEGPTPNAHPSAAQPDIGSTEAVPTGAPHFVAPSSYLRPLSRGHSASAPGSKRSVQMLSPQETEQIEGLVSARRFAVMGMGSREYNCG